MSRESDRRIPAALFILRFFLAIFLLQWSIEKLVLPDAAARIASNFYGVALEVPASYALGVAELILSIALLCGFYRTISYGLSLLVHTVTVIVSGANYSTHGDWPRSATISGSRHGRPGAALLRCS
jgi:putative oxidoreductase